MIIYLMAFGFVTYILKIDLVYCTKRVPDTSDTSVTRATEVTYKRHERDTSGTRVLH